MRVAMITGLVLGLLGGACSSTNQSGDTGVDVPAGEPAGDVVAVDVPGEVLLDVPVDPGVEAAVGDLPSEGAADVGTDVGTDAIADVRADAGTDAGRDAGPADVTSSGLEATLVIGTLFMNCGLPTAPDPLHFLGTLQVRNGTGGTVGPITATGAALVDTGGAELLRFSLSPAMIPALAPAGSGSVMLAKTEGSSVPSPPCGGASRLCGTTAGVVVPLSGTGVPAGLSARSELQMILCAY